MAINPMKLLQLKSSWAAFKENHPRFIPFLQAAGAQIREDAVIEMAVVTPEGKRLETNLKVKASDMELLREAMELANAEKN
jgi:hypothetical protein